MITPSQYPLEYSEPVEVGNITSFRVFSGSEGQGSRDRLLSLIKEVTCVGRDQFGDERDPITDDCGFIIHFLTGDLREGEIHRVLKNAYRIEPFILSLIPGSRRRGRGYANLQDAFPSENAEIALTMGSTEGCAVEYNPETLTISIKYSAGTRMKTKMSGWIQLWERIVSRSLMEEELFEGSTLGDLLSWAGCDPDEKAWYTKRAEELKHKINASIERKTNFSYPGLLYVPSWEEEMEGE
jgi:hypothetical protein